MAKQWDREIKAYLSSQFLSIKVIYFTKSFFSGKILVATTTKCETLES